MKLTVFALLAVLACADSTVDSNLIVQVQQERAVSRAYVETILKFQHSQLTIQASSLLLKALSGNTAASAFADSDDEAESDSDAGILDDSDDSSGAEFSDSNGLESDSFEIDSDSFEASDSDNLIPQTRGSGRSQSFRYEESDSDDSFDSSRRSYLEVESETAPSFGYGTPAYGAPSFGAPVYGAPSFGAPSFGAPSFGGPAPSFGAPSFGSGPAYDPASAFAPYFAASNPAAYGASASPYANTGAGLYGAAPVAAPPQPQYSNSQMRLLFAYNLMYATKMKLVQTVMRSADVQSEFWNDRALQLYVQLAGDSVPPQLLQLLFVKLYRTNLETLKLSLTFQYISHFVTWLEDELDVWGTMSESGSTPLGQAAVMVDQQDDLIYDRMFAFSAYNSFAQLDFQTFYFDLYLESVAAGGSLGGSSLGATAAGQSAGASAFLEEESTAKPFTDILATGSFGAGVASQPYLFLKVYRFYFLLFQMYTAYNGQAAAYADLQSYTVLHDGVAANDQFGERLNGMGVQLMSGFATNLMYSAQMEYVASLFELYLLFAPALAGSLGSSFGSV